MINTTEGLTAFNRFVSGTERMLADTIVIGIGNVAGEFIECEWLRFPVSVLGTDTDNQNTVFKGQVSLPFPGTIYEVGLVQGAGGVSNDVTLASFTNSEDWNASFTTTNVRLYQGVSLNANTNISKNVPNVDLSVFTDDDSIVLAAYAGASGNVTVTMGFDNNSSVAFTFAVTSGYKIYKIARSAGVKSGQVNWSVLTTLTVASTVATTLDLLKVVVNKPRNELTLARKVLTTPVATVVTLPLEVEYPLGVNIVNA